MGEREKKETATKKHSDRASRQETTNSKALAITSNLSATKINLKLRY